MLSLPAGTIAGIAVPSGAALPATIRTLGTVGPWICSEADLRHAAGHGAGCIVVDPRRISHPLLGAALAELRARGTVVLLCAEDVGLLARWAERICFADALADGWWGPEVLLAHRCLEVRVGTVGGGAPEWIRLPLAAGQAPERALAQARADGWQVWESRIGYHAAATR
ncbi:MAG TPA: hypothetical protein VFV65_01440 [Gemmatimonadales bacterium]|nr:hypothetical protein [Gemmatimonadales bacterium]